MNLRTNNNEKYIKDETYFCRDNIFQLKLIQIKQRKVQPVTITIIFISCRLELIKINHSLVSRILYSHLFSSVFFFKQLRVSQDVHFWRLYIFSLKVIHSLLLFLVLFRTSFNVCIRSFFTISPNDILPLCFNFWFHFEGSKEQCVVDSLQKETQIKKVRI